MEIYYPDYDNDLIEDSNNDNPNNGMLTDMADNKNKDLFENTMGKNIN